MKHYVIMHEDTLVKCSFLKYTCYKVLSFADIHIFIVFRLVLNDNYQLHSEK